MLNAYVVAHVTINSTESRPYAAKGARPGYRLGRFLSSNGPLQMNKLKLQLMHREALRRLADAEILSKAMPPEENSDSAYLLKLLGLELLLKIVFEAELNKPGGGHAYEKLFGELPPSLQTKLLALAGERVGPSALVENHELVLQKWGKNFVDLRYPWESYEGLSEEQYLTIGEKWMSKDAPLEEAKFRYYPQELLGFLSALRLVASEIVNSSDNAIT